MAGINRIKKSVKHKVGSTRSRPSRGKKEKHSPDLNLGGEPDPEVMEYFENLRKNVPEPAGRGRQAQDGWDHVIFKLEKGNSLAFPRLMANAIARRGKALGYVIRLTKVDKDFVDLWFGGFEGISKKVGK